MPVQTLPPKVQPASPVQPNGGTAPQSSAAPSSLIASSDQQGGSRQMWQVMFGGDEDASTNIQDGFDPLKMTRPEVQPAIALSQMQTPPGGGFGRGNYSYLKSYGDGPSPLGNHMTIGHCAAAVRTAMEGWGLNTAGHPGTAAEYVTEVDGRGQNFMQRMGFQAVTSGRGEGVGQGYQPRDRDVAVFNNPNNPNDPGHIVRYDGQSHRWLSDFDPVALGFRNTFSGLRSPDNYNVTIFRKDDWGSNLQVASTAGHGSRGLGSPSLHS